MFLGVSLLWSKNMTYDLVGVTAWLLTVQCLTCRAIPTRVNRWRLAVCFAWLTDALYLFSHPLPEHRKENQGKPHTCVSMVMSVVVVVVVVLVVLCDFLGESYVLIHCFPSYNPLPCVSCATFPPKSLECLWPFLALWFRLSSMLWKESFCLNVVLMNCVVPILACFSFSAFQSFSSF